MQLPAPRTATSPHTVLEQQITEARETQRLARLTSWRNPSAPNLAAEDEATDALNAVLDQLCTALRRR